MALKQPQKKLATYFLKPDKEYQFIETDLKKNLNPEVHEEIIAFVQMKTDVAMEKVWDRLKKRYTGVSALDENMPNKPTKEDRTRYIKDFFRLTNPEAVSKDLQAALKFDKIETEYKEFIKQMKKEEYGELFGRYLYPSTFFNTLKQSILTHINQLVASLKRFTDAIADHAWTLDDIRKENKESSFIRGGASVLGLLVGIPFAGAGVGALMGNNSKERAENSLNRVFDGWNLYIDEFNGFLKTLETKYRLAMMTIYGGTILRVNDQLGVYNYTFESMALLSCNYSVTITDQERMDTEQWIGDTSHVIKQLLNKKQWKQGIKVSMELFHVIKQRPVLAKAELIDGKSPLYIANKYYYLSFQEALLEEYKNGHRKEFFATTKKLYEELPLLIQDADIDPEFSKQAPLLFRFIKQALKDDRTEELKIILLYMERVFGRWSTDGYYAGERADSIQNTINESKAFFLVSDFLEDTLNIHIDDDEESEDGPKLYLTKKQLKELKKIDREIGEADELTRYIKFQYIKSFLFPWRNLSFGWMPKYRKKVLASALTAGLMVGGFAYGPEAYDYSKEKISAAQWFSKDHTEAEVITETALIPLTLTVEFANLRETPSLDGVVITEVSSTDKIQYLQEDQIDSGGTVWHNVMLTDGTEGWISGAISKK